MNIYIYMYMYKRMYNVCQTKTSRKVAFAPPLRIPSHRNGLRFGPLAPRRRIQPIRPPWPACAPWYRTFPTLAVTAVAEGQRRVPRKGWRIDMFYPHASAQLQEIPQRRCIRVLGPTDLRALLSKTSSSAPCPLCGEVKS